MKGKHRRLPLDRITTLPRSIIESILCLMPIRDAVSTSILSRKWRYNWVNIPILVFDENELYEVSTNENQLSPRCNLFYTIYQVLLLHRGPILEFTLSMSTSKSCYEVDQIILHLSRNNTVKKLTLDMCDGADYRLPSSFFSLKQLTHLSLIWCDLWPSSTFFGFSGLTTLHLECVQTNTKMILRLISKCLLLESFTLIEYEGEFENERGKSTIVELFECLPMIQHLCMNYYAIEVFAQGGVPRELPISLAHLKHLELLEMHMNEYESSFALLLIRSSPNLEKITIEMDSNVASSQLMGVTEQQDYAGVCLDHLTELEIRKFINFINDLQFLKLILVKSPLLKRVRIELDHTFTNEEELKMLRSILRLPRVSAGVEIIVERTDLTS